MGFARYLSSLNTLPWALMGDFNDLLDEREKAGRVPHPSWLMRGFKGAVSDSGLSNFEFDGHQFTWERGRGTQNWVQEKLDRVLVSGGWRDIFLNAKARSLEGGSSDHMPLFLETNSAGVRRFRRRPRFENSWGKNPECRMVTERAWVQGEGMNIGNRLIECSRAVWNWGRRESGKEVRELRQCTDRMRWLRGAREDWKMREFGVVQRRYVELLTNQCRRWRQRAKELWYRGGVI